MIGLNLTLFIIVNERTRKPLSVLIPADDALYGLLESTAASDQISDRRFIASDIELSPENGIMLTLSSGKPLMYKPVYWTNAWYGLGLEQRLYRCGEITQKLILSLFFFQQKRRHGQRKEGRTDKDVINYLVNLVHAYRFLVEGEKDDPEPVPLREAARAVAYDAETQEPRFLFLMPDDGAIPWPASWTNDGATPGTEQGIERLRKRADRDKPNGY
ncbi:hypothetical protein [Marinobacter sp. tcs-11]|uniref:hypothetical protein n=1 Tax=Marinobacter sp. tcs-11 TaxID=1742860 RepID=UPI0025799BBA|nr:hypothetical protein [Marinobacter sp. tcs-11]MEC9040438.1 hypothetical protein [Pseudomonadota bacterium]